jgi:hypothetical protein
MITHVEASGDGGKSETNLHLDRRPAHPRTDIVLSPAKIISKKYKKSTLIQSIYHVQQILYTLSYEP